MKNYQIPESIDRLKTKSFLKKPLTDFNNSSPSNLSFQIQYDHDITRDNESAVIRYRLANYTEN